MPSMGRSLLLLVSLTLASLATTEMMMDKNILLDGEGLKEVLEGTDEMVCSRNI